MHRQYSSPTSSNNFLQSHNGGGAEPEVDIVDDYATKYLEGLDFHNLDLRGLKTATIPNLLHAVVQCFDESGDLPVKELLPTALFLVHQWFFSSQDLLVGFIQLYRSKSSECASCPSTRHASRNGRNDDREPEEKPCSLGLNCPSFLYKQRICGALKHWISLFPLHFDSNERLKRLVEDLAVQVKRQGLAKQLLPFLDLSAVFLYKQRICGALKHWISLFPLHFDSNERLKRLVEDLAVQVKRQGLAKQLLPFLDLSAVFLYKQRICGALKHWISLFPLHFDSNKRLKRLVEDLAVQVKRQGLAKQLLPFLDLSAVFLYKQRICGALKHWISLFPLHFDSNERLKRLVEDLAVQVKRQGLAKLLLPFLDLSAVPSYAWLRAVSKRGPMVRQVSLSFEQWRPDEIAAALSHIEHRMLRYADSRVGFSEYRQYAASTKLRTTPILEKSISNFNSLSSWVQCMVLTKREPSERADVIIKFIKVGRRLRELQNLNSLMAVLGGLTHSSLARLSRTHDHLSPEYRRELSAFADLLASSANFSAYRRALQAAQGFKIPIIGVHLKDLIALHSAMPDWVEAEGGRTALNVSKLAGLSLIFNHLILDLDRPHNLPPPNMDLINTLKVSLDMRYEDEQIYELSLEREPRSLLNVLTPKPHVFADWAAGVTAAPDPITFHSHVDAMVHAVFKHYDDDRDGYISRAEFDSIAGNFPFLDPFPILDADRDGLISRDEMRDYFVKVNARATAAFRRGFHHHFHETTFLAPTTCSHCTKLLWGLIRQGYKCKDCGIPVHRNCKDELVAECRQRSKPDHHDLALATQVSSPTSSSSSGHGQSSLAAAKKKLFLSLNRKTERERIVSTSASGRTSGSPTPEPTPPAGTTPALASTASHTPMAFQPRGPIAARSRFRLGNRTYSEGGSDHFSYRCQSPEYCEILPSLASEEVFEEESSTGLH